MALRRSRVRIPLGPLFVKRSFPSADETGEINNSIFCPIGVVEHPTASWEREVGAQHGALGVPSKVRTRLPRQRWQSPLVNFRAAFL
jgi:hypothetical protein